MSASMYANPHNRGAVVNQLDAMILGAAEIDLDFNVNVTTGTSGMIIGGSGGHSDTAAGAKLALVTTRLTGGALPEDRRPGHDHDHARRDDRRRGHGGGRGSQPAPRRSP